MELFDRFLKGTQRETRPTHSSTGDKTYSVYSHVFRRPGLPTYLQETRPTHTSTGDKTYSQVYRRQDLLIHLQETRSTHTSTGVKTYSHILRRQRPTHSTTADILSPHYKRYHCTLVDRKITLQYRGNIF
jgi:hypothetical protein